MAEKTETKKVNETAEVKENKFKKLLDLEPFFINKLQPKFKPIIKPIYYVLSVILAFLLLATLMTIRSLGVANTLISALVLCFFFVVLRMWAEYIKND